MDSKKKLPLGKVVENIACSLGKIISDITMLAVTEVRLAKQSAFNILCLSVVLILFGITAIFFLQSLIVVYLISIQFSLLRALFIVTSFDFILILTIVLIISRLRENLNFHAMRRQIHNTKNFIKDSISG